MAKSTQFVISAVLLPLFITGNPIGIGNGRVLWLPNQYLRRQFERTILKFVIEYNVFVETKKVTQCVFKGCKVQIT